MDNKPVQAKSLSSLNELAANPPFELSAQMRRKVRGELTLYIARVPGTRDVFLTTMKPRQQVVTSQDVDSSLYYLHVETAEERAEAENEANQPPVRDDLFEMPAGGPVLPVELAAPEHHAPVEKGRFLPTELPASERNIPVGPGRSFAAELPASERNIPVEQGQTFAAELPASEPNPAGERERLRPPPLPDRLSQLPSPPNSPRVNAGNLHIARKPVSPDPEAHTNDYLVPRPLQPRPSPTRSSPSPESTPGFPSRGSIARRKPLSTHQATSSLEAPLPHRPANPRPTSTGESLPIPVHTMNNKENAPPPPYSTSVVPPMTLRNPSRSAEAPQVVPTPRSRRNSEEAPQAATFRHVAPAPLQLRRETNLSEASTHIGSAASSGSLISQGFTVNVIRRDPATGNQWNIGRFTKDGKSLNSSADKVALEITSGAYDKFKDEADEGETGYGTLRPFKRNLFLNRTRKSASQRPSPGFRAPTELRSEALQPPDVGDAANTPFSFTSPWNGSCDFSNSVSGRTMRCRHYHSPEGATFTAGIDSTMGLSNSSAVSELRFNLPIYKKKAPEKKAPAKKSRPMLSSAASSRSSIDSRLSVGGLRNRLSRSVGSALGRGDSDDDNSDDTNADSLDLSLGQESAGGGIIGNKAKLGKLIIEGDGMLMLDLAVMANMGLWWTVASKFK